MYAGNDRLVAGVPSVFAMEKWANRPNSPAAKTIIAKVRGTHPFAEGAKGWGTRRFTSETTQILLQLKSTHRISQEHPFHATFLRN
jgi:hypothetical protein